MTLWRKPIETINFEDIDLFCQAAWEESVRLDYKGDFPKDTAKTMAAMANTVGGMIILGVDADKTNNKPIWPPQPIDPPQTGLPSAPGHAERVYQIARDSIFPPLMVEVSPVIDNALAPGQAIVVVRIPESKDAPHATEGKKHVYVYERTGNQNFAYHHADIEYIERLFHRRRDHPVFCRWHSTRSSGRTGRNNRTVEQWPRRGPSEPPEGDQEKYVWPGRLRPPAGTSPAQEVIDVSKIEGPVCTPRGRPPRLRENPFWGSPAFLVMRPYHVS